MLDGSSRTDEVPSRASRIGWWRGGAGSWWSGWFGFQLLLFLLNQPYLGNQLVSRVKKRRQGMLSVPEVLLPGFGSQDAIRRDDVKAGVRFLRQRELGCHGAG